MRLAGRANWWAPAWMRRVHERFGLSEGEPPEPPEPQEPQETQEPVGDDGESRPEPLVPAAVG
jgi:RND superfamily putative drug exporter